MEFEMLKKIPFSIAPRKMKYLGINIQDIYKLYIYIYTYMEKDEILIKNLKLSK